MTVVAPSDARQFVRGQLEEIAISRHPGESVKAMLGRVSREVGLGFSKVRRYWYGEVDNIPWHEAETIRQRAQQVKDRWQLMQVRQSQAEAETRRKRTHDYGEEIKGRIAACEGHAVDREEDGQSRQFHFWLGRSSTELDREGDA